MDIVPIMSFGRQLPLRSSTSIETVNYQQLLFGRKYLEGLVHNCPDLLARPRMEDVLAKILELLPQLPEE